MPGLLGRRPHEKTTVWVDDFRINAISIQILAALGKIKAATLGPLQIFPVQSKVTDTLFPLTFNHQPFPAVGINLQSRNPVAKLRLNPLLPQIWRLKHMAVC